MRHIILVLSFCGILLTGCNQNDKIQENNNVKVGAIVELTGSIPAVGASSKNAAELAVQEINAKGGLTIQGKKMPVELVIEDNADQADQSAASVHKLIEQNDVVAIVGPNASLGAVPAAEIAESEKIVLITPWSTNPKVTINSRTQEPKQYVFRACFTDPFEGKILARYALNELKYTTAAVLYDVSSEAPHSQAQLFEQSFTEAGGKIVASETFTANDKDFTAQLTKIKAANPEVIFLPAYYNDVPLITQQAKRLGIQAAFLGSDGWSSPDLLTLSNGTVEGSYFINHYSPDSTNKATQDFVAAYKKVYGTVPDDVAALTYDSMYVLFNAIELAQSTDRQAIRESLAKLPAYHGVTGTIEYKNGLGDPVKSGVIMQVKNNKFTWVADAKA